jgi:hypothetical protein
MEIQTLAGYFHSRDGQLCFIWGPDGDILKWTLVGQPHKETCAVKEIQILGLWVVFDPMELSALSS